MENEQRWLLWLSSVLIVLVPVGLACRPEVQTVGEPPSESREAPATKLVLLGTGTPNAEPDRWGTASAVVVNDTAYLIDCGPGVVRRAAAAARLGIPALKPPRLQHLFITHLHSDHTAGYPDLILTPWVLERTRPLIVYGPPGTQRMTDHLLAAYDEDIQLRLHGLEPANPDGYRVEVHEISPGIIHRDDNVTVTAFPVAHGSWRHAFGFRFESADRTIVLSGDTAPTDSLIEHARGCDILLHEVYSQAGFDRREPVWQRYHSAFHTSATELARIANEARPGLLVLHHQLYWGTTDRQLLDEIRAHYPAPVVSGKDLDVY